MTKIEMKVLIDFKHEEEEIICLYLNNLCFHDTWQHCDIIWIQSCVNQKFFISI